MGLISVIAPEETINLITNPSFEVGTSGWTAVGGSIARGSASPAFGLYELAITPTSGVNDGVYFGTVSLTSGTTYTFSAVVRGVVSVPYSMFFATTGGVAKGTATTFTGTGSKEIQEVSWTCDSTDSYRVYIIKNNSANEGVFYVDGAQAEAKAYRTTYCDGDQGEGFYWSGVAHASASTREATAWAGGRIRDIEDIGFYLETMLGDGVPPTTHYSTDYAILPGALHERAKVNSRTLILNGTIRGTSWANFLTNRATLLDVIKLDDSGLDQPLRLRYTGGSSTLELKAYCEGGLEGGVRTGHLEKIAMRFLATDPFWYEVL